MDGISAFDLWDLVIEVLHSSYNQSKKSKEDDLELYNVDYVFLKREVFSIRCGASHFRR